MNKQTFKRLLRAVKADVPLRYIYYKTRFCTQYLQFKEKNKKYSKRFNMSWKTRYPCLHDNTNETYFDRHYIYHTGWAARVLAKTKPSMHTDISSSLYFVSIASAFVPTTFYDYRPADLRLSNLQSGSQDLCNLTFADNSVESLSCMHVLEHIGLGRYGDPVDPEGDLKAISELQRVLAPGGSLLFVVPVGKPTIMFNAHRIYSPNQIISAFDKLELKEFSLIPENQNDGGITSNPSNELLAKQICGCGCFWFTKRIEKKS